MSITTYQHILNKKKAGQKLFAILVDPDKFTAKGFLDTIINSGVDLLLIGGSLLTNGNLEECIQEIKSKTDLPVLIFPGNVLQVNKHADGILLLSLISGRNAEMLIGNHVLAAPLLKKSGIEIIPTGYVLIDGGRATSVSYISNTTPIPADKYDIAACTAIAGEQLGLKMIYLEAGSGAVNVVSEAMISEVKKNIEIPLIVGGGINSPEKALACCKAGADVIVIGNAAEKDMNLIKLVSEIVHSF